MPSGAATVAPCIRMPHLGDGLLDRAPHVRCQVGVGAGHVDVRGTRVVAQHRQQPGVMLSRLKVTRLGREEGLAESCENILHTHAGERGVVHVGDGRDAQLL